MKPLEGIRHFGDLKFRDPKCPREGAEQVTFFNQLRKGYPDTYGMTAVHTRNEGKKTPGQVQKEKAEGMAVGTPDIAIPGNPAFLCELKRKDRTLSDLQPGQEPYLRQAQAQGAWCCIAFGWEAAMEAFHEWRELVECSQPN